MAELSITEPPSGWVTGLNLYCWPCSTTHALALADVERLVYALGAAEADGRLAILFAAHGAGADARAELVTVNQADSGPECLLELLRWASSPEGYLEQVEQGQECRYWSGPGRADPPQHLVDAYDGGPIPEPHPRGRGLPAGRVVVDEVLDIPPHDVDLRGGGSGPQPAPPIDWGTGDRS